MNSLFRNFYRNFYHNTGGYIPAAPLQQNIYPGDFFQIRGGELIILGNLFRNGLIDAADVSLDYNLKLNPAYWTFSDGVSKPYPGRGNGHKAPGDDFEFSRQVLTFANAGSFTFKAASPEVIRLHNWEAIQQQLIIKLTQIFYSFREVYVVTESVACNNWALAVASSNKAELEIAEDGESFGLIDIFGSGSARTIQSRDIEYYHREHTRRPNFFKAKKLVVNHEQAEIAAGNFVENAITQNTWAKDFYGDAFDHDAAHFSTRSAHSNIPLLDMLAANQLNPNTALQYFAWADANLDDIEQLFKE